MMKQGEAVFQAVSKAFGEFDSVPETGKWSEEQKRSVYETVFQMFKSGQTTHSGNPDDAKLLKYIPGLVNNWVRKDPRLNGGSKYQTKRPGSRTGSGDEGIKAMRTLLTLQKDPTVREQIQAAIDARLEELKPKAEIKVDALPESLRHLVKVG